MAKSELEGKFELQLRAIKAPEHIRECMLKKLMPCHRDWRCDFAWPEYKLIVEIEGGTYMKKKTGHTTSKGYKDNCEKYNHCALNGYKVLRFDSYHVRYGFAIQTICEFFGIKI
jgi:very-short-patch-repair endonuclease